METRDFQMVVLRMKLFLRLQSFTCHIVNIRVLIYVFTNVVIKIKVFHTCRTHVLRVAIVSHSCRTRVVRVALVSHLCRQCRIRVARICHSCCKLDQISFSSRFFFNNPEVSAQIQKPTKYQSIKRIVVFYNLCSSGVNCSM